MSRLTGGQRTAFLYFGLGCFSLMAAECTLAFAEYYFGVWVPNFVGPFFILFPFFFILGIWHYHDRKPSKDVTLVRIGNLGIILSATLFIYVLVYADYLREQTVPLALSAVVYNVLELSAMAVLALRVWGPRPTAMLLIALAFGIDAIADAIDYFRLENRITDVLSESVYMVPIASSSGPPSSWTRESRRIPKIRAKSNRKWLASKPCSQPLPLWVCFWLL
jgi:hypothetical protein